LTAIVLVIHIVACLVMILVVLLQAGKGAEMGAAFGGASKTVFGPRGAAGPLAKVTIVAATLFVLTSLFLTWDSKHRRAPSVVDTVETPAPLTEGATPPAGEPGAPAGEVPAPITPVGEGGGQPAPLAPLTPAPEGGSSSLPETPGPE